MRQALELLHSAVFWALVLVYSVVIHTVTNIAALFIRGDEKKEALYRASGKLWGRLLVDAALVKVNISGLDNIPTDTNVIYTPNHQSYMDIFILLKYLPGSYKFVIMRKLFEVPVVGRHITQAGFISLDRKDRKSSVNTIHSIIDELARGESFVIFPEGRLTSDGSIGQFGRGTSIIIQRSRKTVVPIAIDGTFDALPKGRWRIKRSLVNVKIGKPVLFEDHAGDVDKDSSYALGDRLRGIVAELKG